MQKYLILSLLLVLSACTLPWSKQDLTFQWLYKTNIHATIASFDELTTLLGINRHESIDGTIHSSVSVPGILSGSLASDYIGNIDGRNSESFFRNIRLLFTSLVSSGSISADEIGLAWHGADTYVSYKNLVDAGMMSDDIKTVLKKYENTWLSLAPQTNIGMSPDELMGYNMGHNILTKSLADIEKYATSYPVFHDTADLGMSGSLHYWSVELDRASILSLSKQLTVDLAGTGMTDADSATLAKNLESASFSGKIGYDPADPMVSMIEGSVSLSGRVLADIATHRDKDGGSIYIGNMPDKTSIVIHYGKKENRYVFDTVLSQGTTEIGKVVWYIEYVDNKFHELSIEASTQGMTATLRHTVDGDHFLGKLSAIIGTLEWSGTTGDNQVKSLKIDATSPVGSVHTDLIESTGGMIRGPIVIKSGEETLMNATLALALAKEKFAMILDVISEEFPAHFDIDISAKSTPSTRVLSAPTNTRSIQDLMKEIEALTPPQAFSETPESGSGDVESLSGSINFAQ